jgi:hypothetical protein
VSYVTKCWRAGADDLVVVRGGVCFGNSIVFLMILDFFFVVLNYYFYVFFRLF